MEAFHIASQYKKDAVEIFSSEVQNVNFGASAKAAEIINKWVFVFFFFNIKQILLCFLRFFLIRLNQKLMRKSKTYSPLICSIVIQEWYS